MVTGMLDQAELPFGPPEINRPASSARVVPQDPGLLLRSYVTAGATDTVADISGAWNRYIATSGLLEVDYRADPIQITGSSFGSHFLSTTGTELDVPEAGSGTGDTYATGSDFGVTPYVVALRPTIESVNVTRIIAESLVDETYLQGVLQVNADPLTEYRAVRRREATMRVTALEDIRKRLDQERAVYVLKSPREVAAELGDELGVGQLVIARALGVTPTAVRKWRRGEPARSEHRDRLSQLAAFCSALIDVGLHDPAGWVDIPISGESTLTPLDLFLHRQADLAVLLGAGLADPQEVLDAFDPGWRESFAIDSDYEVVRLADGSFSVVPREGEKS